jgi:hypothetical protein
MLAKLRCAWLLMGMALATVHCSSGAVPTPTVDANAPDGAMEASPPDAVLADTGAVPQLVPGPDAQGPGPDAQSPGAEAGPQNLSPDADAPPHKVPGEHRAQAVACQPTATAPKPPGGGAACASDSDCAGDANTLFPHCLRGRCAFDQCLSDSDCHDGVCGCSTDYYGGNINYHPNICVPSNCHVDADCGSDGYCSPNRGHCGTFQGFFCHHPADRCYDASECPGPGLRACLYTPTVGAYVCSTAAVCNG